VEAGCAVRRVRRLIARQSINLIADVRRLRYLKGWMDQLRWQRLIPFQRRAEVLLEHVDGILYYCRTKVPLGVVEAINGNIKPLLRRGRGYRTDPRPAVNS
jgi:transposase